MTKQKVKEIICHLRAALECSHGRYTWTLNTQRNMSGGLELVVTAATPDRANNRSLCLPWQGVEARHDLSDLADEIAARIEQDFRN